MPTTLSNPRTDEFGLCVCRFLCVSLSTPGFFLLSCHKSVQTKICMHTQTREFSRRAQSKQKNACNVGRSYVECMYVVCSAAVNTLDTHNLPANLRAAVPSHTHARTQAGTNTPINYGFPYKVHANTRDQNVSTQSVTSDSSIFRSRIRPKESKLKHRNCMLGTIELSQSMR